MPKARRSLFCAVNSGDYGQRHWHRFGLSKNNQGLDHYIQILVITNDDFAASYKDWCPCRLPCHNNSVRACFIPGQYFLLFPSIHKAINPACLVWAKRPIFKPTFFLAILVEIGYFDLTLCLSDTDIDNLRADRPPMGKYRLMPVALPVSVRPVTSKLPCSLSPSFALPWFAFLLVNSRPCSSMVLPV